MSFILRKSMSIAEGLLYGSGSSFLQRLSGTTRRRWIANSLFGWTINFLNNGLNVWLSVVWLKTDADCFPMLYSHIVLIRFNFRKDYCDYYLPAAWQMGLGSCVQVYMGRGEHRVEWGCKMMVRYDWSVFFFCSFFTKPTACTLCCVWWEFVHFYWGTWIAALNAVIFCVHIYVELLDNSQNNTNKQTNKKRSIRRENPPRSSIYGCTLVTGSSLVGLWSVNISVNTKAKTAHSWQKLRPLKFYYGKSHFACSPANVAIKTSWQMPGDLFK